MSERVIPVDWSRDPREARLEADLAAIKKRFPHSWQQRQREEAETAVMTAHFADAE